MTFTLTQLNFPLLQSVLHEHFTGKRIDSGAGNSNHLMGVTGPSSLRRSKSVARGRIGHGSFDAFQILATKWQSKSGIKVSQIGRRFPIQHVFVGTNTI